MHTTILLLAWWLTSVGGFTPLVLQPATTHKSSIGMVLRDPSFTSVDSLESVYQKPAAKAAPLTPELLELKAAKEDLLTKSYDECQKITAHYAKTFYLGSQCISLPKAQAIWAVYAWCRRTDDIVDSPRVQSSPELLRRELEEWTGRLDNIWTGQAHDVIDIALVDTVQKHHDLDIVPFKDMVRGMVMDTHKDRYETFEDLREYCYCVAGTVGLMMLPVMGTARDATYEEAVDPALALGIALQLTNIIRDVGEDAQTRQRIYLPMEDLAAFGITEEDVFEGKVDDKWKSFMQFQIKRARSYFKMAEEGIPMLAPDAQLPVKVSADVYGQILDQVEANGYDNFNKRAYVDKPTKLASVLKCWWQLNKPI